MSNVKRRSNATAIVGLILIATTIAVFFLLTGNPDPIDWIGFFFIVIPEILVIGGIIALDRAADRSHGVLLRSGGYSTLLIYGGLAVLTSIICLMAFREAIVMLVVIQLLLAAVSGIILVPIIASSSSIALKDAQTLDSVAKMQAIAGQVLLLQNNPQYVAFSTELKAVYEGLRYCDVSSEAPADAKIAEKLPALELLLSSERTDETDTQIYKQIEDILTLIRQRTMEVKEQKRKGI